MAKLDYSQIDSKYHMEASQLPERQLQRKISETENTLKKLTEINSKLCYQGTERINKTALFHVEIKHTNEITLKLGCDYYVQMKTDDATKVLQSRLTHYRQKLSKLKKQAQNVQSAKKSSQKLGKQSKASLEGSHTGFLECIGEENGQSIFNIVEIEGEDQGISETTKDNSTNKMAALAAIPQEKIEQPVEQHEENRNEKIALAPSIKEKQNVEADEQQASKEQSDSQGNYSDENIEDDGQYEDEQEQYDDIIINRRAKLGLIPQGMPKIPEETPKTHHWPLEPKAHIQAEDKAEVKKEIEKKSVKKVQEQEIPQKISRFKLQRMKQKLQKQL